MPRVRIDPGFVRALSRRNPEIQVRAEKALVRFQENPQAHGLNFERVKSMGDYYSIRINLQFRILLRRERDDEGELFAAVDMGTHQVYRRR